MMMSEGEYLTNAYCANMRYILLPDGLVEFDAHVALDRVNPINIG